MELQGRLAELKSQGLGLAAISYDAPETLKTFAESRGLTFFLISDPGSAIIKQYGILNTNEKPGTRNYGIPFPGTFIVDRRGIVQSRHFEDAYQERSTAASILVQRGTAPLGSIVTAEAQHLTVVAAASDDQVAPGQRLTLVFDVTPRRNIHVYAPGKHSYQIVNVSLDPQPWFRAHPTVYSKSEIYHFKPLNERVAVYQKPFRLTKDVTMLATPEAQKIFAGRRDVTLSGQLEYQACDDKLCYSPQSLPLQWKLTLRPLDRKPAG